MKGIARPSGPQETTMSDLACESIPEGDHRALAQRLDLLHFQDEAPGMAFWRRYPDAGAYEGVI